MINLDGLGHFADTVDLRIVNNPLLSACNDPKVCNHFINGGRGVIENNAPGCNSIDQVLDACSNQLSKVNYQIFYDSNQNQIREAEEPYYQDAGLLLEPSGVLHYPTLNNVGILFLEEGDYEFSLDLNSIPDWQFTTDSLTYHLQIDEPGSCDTLNFGLYPEQLISKTEAYVNAPPARCNTFIPVEVHAKNLGTTVTEGTLWLSIDPQVDSIQFVNTPDTIIGSNQYGWYFTDLFPGQSLSTEIRIEVPGPPEVMLGDKLQLTAQTDFSDLDGDHQSTVFDYQPAIRCSFDPNDKLVSPQRDSNHTYFGEDLIYTIRFQNTGNDVAFDIFILDTLDANLDPSSFRLLSTSHPSYLQASRNNDRYLRFDFKNIFLPDSSANFEASQGYVSYLIRPKDGLPEQTPIFNTASIYFDLNPPIVTNTTESILVSEPTATREIADLQLRLFPNPLRDQLHLQSSRPFEGTLQISDCTGRLLLQQELSGDTTADLSQLSRGVYFATIRMGNHWVTEKIVKL
ncbi:MAG: T9SS type A sorting domain-containing protein [Bacteroidota bacterium]